MKKCSRCEKVKEESDFRKDKHSKDGLTYSCKRCISLADIKSRVNKSDLETKHSKFIKLYLKRDFSISELSYIFSCSKNEIKRAAKYFQLDQDLTNKIYCPRCKKWKDKDSEYRLDRSNNTGRTCWCIECIDSHRKRPDIRERERKRNAEYYLENKNRIDRINKEYYQNHVTEHSYRVRYNKLLRKRATPRWANYQKIAEFYEKAAQLTNETGIQYEVDHIIPIKGKNVCGLHVENNLQILTRYENRKKLNSLKTSKI